MNLIRAAGHFSAASQSRLKRRARPQLRTTSCVFVNDISFEKMGPVHFLLARAAAAAARAGPLPCRSIGTTWNATNTPVARSSWPRAGM